MSKLRRSLLSVVLVLVCVAGNAQDPDSITKQIETIGPKGGLIVHIGCGDAKATAAMKLSERYVVHGIDRDAATVRAARKWLRAAGQYGAISVDQWVGDALPYVDNFANMVVIADGVKVDPVEVNRILAPKGVVLDLGSGKSQIKPRPDNIDDWTHYMHDASGNAVAHDDVVAPPRHLQWLGSPRWSRHHDRMASMSALVSANGRLVYIMDEGSRISIQLPSKWKLIARDAFNGTVLWKQPIQTWQSHLWPLKSGPTQLARRLVAIGDKVFATMGLEAPVSMIDAATGETLKTFEETHATEELIVEDGIVFALAHDGPHPLRDFAPVHNTGDQARVRSFNWNEQARRIVAVDSATGDVLWQHESRVTPLTLSAGGGKVFFHDGGKVVCLDAKTGDKAWETENNQRRSKIPFNFGCKLVIYKDVVLFAGGDRKMHSYDIQSGKKLWSAEHAQSGYQSPEDLLVSGGMVWSAPTTQTKHTGVYTGRDPKTGEVKVEFPPNVETYWFHHRCYMAKATDNFLMPSRTGIEFVDFKKKDWDINHWVRGGCLYGVMPCNGMVYAPPHNCACYPEAKLYGLNALAPPSPTRNLPDTINEADRLWKGPAYDADITAKNQTGDWPTYRHDSERTALAGTEVPAKLKTAWQTKKMGKLSSVVVAAGRVYVAEIDAHTVHALDEKTGEPVWDFTTGARVDSPPAVQDGRVVFGSADGHVYCVRASDGELIWRYRAAPIDRRLMSFEQLESVWPVHGNTLIQDDVVFAIAGRSNFLDGGLRMVRLDLATGQQISETIINEKDPETGKNMQDKLQVLQMGVGLSDILSSNGDNVFMRSQKFDLEGKRMGTGPNSGDFAGQASVQGGSDAHVFAPMGFLDDTWFHRSYWVFGKSFAGGHGGYYQAGRFAPSGRILVFDDDHVFGFGRKPEYLKWTTTLEHQLFSAPREAPVVPADAKAKRRGKGKTAGMVKIPMSKKLDPTGKAFTIEAWVNSGNGKGVVLAHGGPAQGYALVMQQGKPVFHVRSSDNLSTLAAKAKTSGRWVHLAAVLTKDKVMRVYVDGQKAAEGEAQALITSNPAQGMEIGGDDASAVATYQAPFSFNGKIDEVRIYHAALTDADVLARFNDPKSQPSVSPVAAWSFDGGKAKDSTGNGHDGTMSQVFKDEGKTGDGIRIQPSGNNQKQSNAFVKYDWTEDVPLLVRSMVLTPTSKGQDHKRIFILGPPDIVDEEESFKRLTEKDPKVQELLVKQDEALNGLQGGILRSVDASNGKTLAELKTDFLPVWDSLAAANGRLFVSTTDGRVISLAGE